MSNAHSKEAATEHLKNELTQFPESPSKLYPPRRRGRRPRKHIREVFQVFDMHATSHPRATVNKAPVESETPRPKCPFDSDFSDKTVVSGASRKRVSFTRWSIADMKTRPGKIAGCEGVDMARQDTVAEWQSYIAGRDGWISEWDCTAVEGKT